MSIFCNDVFDIEIYYTSQQDEKGVTTGIQIVNADHEGAKKLSCKAKGRDFESMSRVMEEATIINHISGKPMVRSGVLCRLILLNFFVSWDATGDQRQITPDVVGSAHYMVPRILARQWLLMTGGKAV